jgi:hypothetical protein
MTMEFMMEEDKSTMEFMIEKKQVVVMKLIMEFMIEENKSTVEFVWNNELTATKSRRMHPIIPDFNMRKNQISKYR